ncbi:MAG: hypothetical protein ACRC6V_12270 [Bacteroidales bacterium]
MKALIDSDIFKVFPDGSVRLPSGKISYGSPDTKGYRRVSYKKKFYYVHRLVAFVYIENQDNLPQVNHKNMNTSDNRVENLEWCNNRHNTCHSIENNKSRKYVQPGKARKSVLTNEEILWVVKNLGCISQLKMARELGVTGRVIYHIKNGITHSNITKIQRTDRDGSAHGKEVLRK